MPGTDGWSSGGMVAELRRTTSDGSSTAGAAATVVLTVLVCLAAVVWTPTPAAAAVPAGFTEVVAFDGLQDPTAVRFAPDGRVFVAEKRGTIQMFDGLDDTTATTVADLRTEVHDFWDRGLLGLAVDTAFPGRPYLYAMYTFDGPIGGTAPRWGTAGADSDPCPSPPGANSDGCVVSSKLVKLTIDLTDPSADTTSRQDLVNDWCQQYPSHSAGDLVFGPDGALYASGGDGAGFEFVDYGQDGDPLNPCDDPPGGAGAAMTPPTAEGGALRAQDLRTPGDPVGLDGTVIRVSPDTGLPLADNPAAGAADVNAQRIVADGLRNPFRMTSRPGTGELWIGDTGWNDWEEVNRLADPQGGVANFGWPCVEGDDPQPGYDAADLQVCEDLYAQGDADAKAFHRYRHGQPLDQADDCKVTSGASTSGLAFQREEDSPYPAEYDGALFLADYSRGCIWVMPEGADGLPDANAVRPFVTGAASPVDLELSPQGELFYADIAGGTVRRVRHVVPDAASCPAGEYLAEYYPNTTLTGGPASRTCERPPLDHDCGSGAPVGVGPDEFSARWTGTFDFPSAGTYTFTAVADDGIRVTVDGDVLIDQWLVQPAAAVTGARALAAGSHEVVVEWFEAGGAAVAGLAWSADSSPQPTITGPESGTTWAVGDTIAFSGSATDPEDGALPESSLSWRVVLQHCPDSCHAHELQSFQGVGGGSVAAPNHEYPAHLELQLTATDRAGLSTTVTRRLDPQPVAVSVASEPAGLQLTVGSQTATAPFTRTLIVGATASLSAPTPQTWAGTTYQFTGWSDGGAQSHNVTAGATDTTYTATYAAVPSACPGGACPGG